MINEDKLNEVISKINIGRLIDIEKVCPLIGKSCIGINCNAFVTHHDINFVSYDEVVDYLNNGHTDWKEKIEKDGWKLHHIFDEMFTCRKDYLFTKQPEEIGIKFGRCVWGCN